MGLGQAQVGHGAQALKSDTRTAEVGWIRWDDAWSHRIISRTAELLGFNVEDLHEGGLAEMLQVASYGVGGKYSPHTDFGDSKFDRMLTFLHYIEPASAGGHGGTAFPLAFGRKGLTVNAPAG